MVVRFTILLFLLLNLKLDAQVVINEFSAANLKGFLDNYGKEEDWVELYNSSNSPVNLEGWYLSDNEGKPTKWKIPAGVTILPKSFLVVFASGRNEFENGYLHADWKLNQTEQEDFVILSKPDKSIVDKYKLPIIQLNQSVCRKADAGPDWGYTTIPTPGETNELYTEFQFNGFAPKPQVSITAGYYDTTVVVRLSSAIPSGFKVRYTTNGREPKMSSPEFPDSLEITSTAVLKVRTFSDDALIFPSLIDFNTYFIKEDFTLPVFSVSADKLTELAEGEKELRPIGAIEYFDKTKERKSIGYGELNSHGQDSWVLNQRSLDWITRDEMGYAAAITEPLFDLSAREEFQRFIFRASGDDNYPAISDGFHNGSCHIRDEYVHVLAKEGDMHLDVRTPQRVNVFLNGEYWGVYAIRERPDDHDYTDFFYKQDKYDLQYLQTWANSWAEYGDEEAKEDWADLRDYILDNDMSDSAKYKFVTEQMDLISLSDYFIMNLNVVASDWLNYNTGWWRGLNEKGTHRKWGYTLWDNDATFDYYINYSGVPNVSPDALPCDIEQIADYINNFFGGNDLGKHEQILLKLLDESPAFRQLYYSRYADLMNTVFSCENMLNTLDRMIADIEPDMPRHVDRWGGTMNKWHTNLNKMRTFIEERCLNLDGGLIECYEPENSYSLTLMTNPAEVGKISLNTLNHDELPWAGRYYDNMDQLVNTVGTNTEYKFSHWSDIHGNITYSDSTLANTKIQISGNDTLIANYTNTLSNNDFSIHGAKVYPNPTNDLLQIETGDLNKSESIICNVTDASGRTIYTQKLKSGGRKNKITISLQQLSLANGVYLVRLTTADKHETFKVTYLK